MRSICSIITLVGLLLAQVSFAQNFEVPKDFTPNTKDFPKYAKDVVNCENWLENTPVNEQADKRKEACGFMVAWISGSPDVSMEISPNIVTFTEADPQLLMCFMGGWAKYAIEHPKDTSKLSGNAAGLRSAIKLYKKNPKSIKRADSMDQLVALEDKGKLDKWVAEQLKK